MNDPAAPVTQSLRAMLLGLELSQDEVERFLTRLREELLAGSITDKEALQRFVDDHVDTLVASGRFSTTTPTDTFKSITLNLLISVVGGVAGTALWEELIQPLFRKPPQPVTNLVPEDPNGGILLDWWVPWTTKNMHLERLEPALRRCLEARQQRYGVADERTAFSMDALAMCLDARGRHSEARRLRETVYRVEETLRGQHHKATAVALSNLAVCAAEQGRYRQAAKAELKASKILKLAYGPNSVAAGCMAVNMYEMGKRLGRIPSNAFSPIVADNAFRDTGKFMMLRKYLIVLLGAMKECVEQLKMALQTAK